MALGFLIIILTGSLLLMLPVSSVSRTVTPFPDTLFTSVSATCVTGLVVVDTGTHWSLFGQCVILCMIQIGGLGFMSFALMLAGTLRQSASPRVRNLTAQSLGMDSVDGMQKFVRRIFTGTAVIEGTGALLLTIRPSRYRMRTSRGNVNFPNVRDPFSPMIQFGFTLSVILE